MAGVPVQDVERALFDEELEARWDECLAGWPDPPDGAAEATRDWIADIRDGFVEVVRIIAEPNDIEMALITWYLHLRSQWALYNMQCQYAMVKQGIPNYEKLFRASLLTTLLDAVEPLLTYIDVERSHEAVASPLMRTRADTFLSVRRDKYERLVDTLGRAAAVRLSLGSPLHQLHTTAEGEEAQGQLSKIERLGSELERTYNELNRLMEAVQEQALGLRLVPVRTLFERLERFAEQQGERYERTVRVHTSGGDVKLDQDTAKALVEPMIHLVRSMVAGSLEPAAKRKEKGKPAAGHLNFSATYHGGSIHLNLYDDGAGPDAEALEAHARSKGVLDEDVGEALSGSARRALIFDVGFPGELADDLSADRLQRTKRIVEQCGGDIYIRPPLKAKGLHFRVVLPVAMTFTSLLIVRVGDERFALPMQQVREMVQVQEEKIHTVGGHPMVNLRGDHLVVLNLGTLVGHPQPASGRKNLVILEGSNRLIALQVTDFIKQVEAALHPIETPLLDVKYVLGATILEDNTAALVLDPSELARTERARTEGTLIEREVHGSTDSEAQGTVAAT